jgi:hypothetical protein
MSTRETIPATMPSAVAGWLLLFCLILTIVYPASTFYAVGWLTIPVLLSTSGHFQALTLGVYCIVFTGLAIFSIIAGLKLWMIKPQAVIIAKRFLLAYFAGNVAYFAFWLIMTRPNTPLSLALMVWYHVVSPIAFTILWNAYLNRSKRVRATYS